MHEKLNPPVSMPEECCNGGTDWQFMDSIYGCCHGNSSTLQLVAVDIMGPFPKSEAGKERLDQRLDREQDLHDQHAHGKPITEGDLLWLHSSALSNGQGSSTNHRLGPTE